MDKIIKTGEKTGVKVEEYKGVISLSAQNIAGEKNYTVWAMYQKGKGEFQEKSWPVKVTLGDKDNVINILREIAAAVGFESQDVPF
jgi:hypothetical protein